MVLVERDRVPGVRLDIAGAVTADDHEFVRGLKDKLEQAGCADRVTWRPNVSLEGKLEFLRGLSVMSVPATYGEAFGLYILEAQASAVPVVQPRHGGFPEILAATGGGVLVEPDDVKALAEGLEALLLDPDKVRELGRQGREAVLEKFNGDTMAEGFERVLARVTGDW